MHRPRQNVVGTNVRTHGGEVYYELARSDEWDPWVELACQPQCPLLLSRSLAHMGTMQVAAPFAISRTEQPGTILFSCFVGTGSVFVDGRRFRLAAGEACIIPQGSVAFLCCNEREVWSRRHTGRGFHLRCPQIQQAYDTTN